MNKKSRLWISVAYFISGRRNPIQFNVLCHLPRPQRLSLPPPAFPSFPAVFLSRFSSAFLHFLPSAIATFPPFHWLSALFSLARIIPVQFHFTFSGILIAHMNLSASTIWSILNRINVHPITHIIRLRTISCGKKNALFLEFSSWAHRTCVCGLLGIIIIH